MNAAQAAKNIDSFALGLDSSRFPLSAGCYKRCESQPCSSSSTCSHVKVTNHPLSDSAAEEVMALCVPDGAWTWIRDSRPKVQARMCWARPEEGGRPTIPNGPRYVASGHFPGVGGASRPASWSVIVDIDTTAPEHPRCSTGSLRFFADDGPAQLLRPGMVFDLNEGNRRVATVEVL